MGLINTTVLRASPTTSDVGDAAPADTTSAPTFITKESLATFAGQTAAVTLIWKLFGGSDGSKWIPGIAVVVISLAIWLSGWSAVKEHKEQILLSLVIAAVNGCMVYAAVIGVDVVGDQAGVSDATNPAISDAAQ
jgi:hypothetical protein